MTSKKNRPKAIKKNLSIEELFTKSKTDELPIPVYANHARVNVNGSEINLDFFNVAPIPGKDAESYAVRHLVRIAIPHHLGKGLATAIANSIAVYEEATDTKFPNEREHLESDRIVIWE